MENTNDIKKVIQDSRCVHQVLLKLGKNTTGSCYRWFRDFVKDNNVDTSHFMSKSEYAKHLYKDGVLHKLDDSDIFCKDSKAPRATLRKRVISENLIEYKCIKCGNKGSWKKKRITLILDHIDGDRTNNVLSNLRFLCPNCNATLETHCLGHIRLKNKKDKVDKRKFPNINLDSKKHLRKVERPKLEILQKQVEEFGYRGTGKIYGVSDNCIKKWINLYIKYNKK